MLPLIVLVGALAVVWHLEYWPFDRSYQFIPKHGEKKQKADAATGAKPGA
jgi:hypothetical protein